MEFKIDIIQKKSTLNPKSYQSSLMSLLMLFDPITIINPESISKFYGCPSLKNLIEEIQFKAEDKSIESAVAATYLIGQITKLKHFGTLSDLSKLWIQSVVTLRQVSDELKVHCDAVKLKDFSKILTDEIKQSKEVDVIVSQKRTASPRSAAKNPKTTKISSDIPASVHPLILFNCSTSGPAFGPILY
jgi:hypothetical protein